MLTTIIKTKNSEDIIAQTLESVKDLGNIIVLDEHSNDDTILIAKEYKAQIIYFSSLSITKTFSKKLEIGLIKTFNDLIYSSRLSIFPL